MYVYRMKINDLCWIVVMIQRMQLIKMKYLIKKKIKYIETSKMDIVNTTNNINMKNNKRRYIYIIYWIYCSSKKNPFYHRMIF